jgi:hypothetical protein
MTAIVALTTPGPTNLTQVPTSDGGQLSVIGETINVPTGVPVRGFGQSGASPIVLTAAAQIVASVTVTPGATGKLTVFVSGVVDNNDSGATRRPVTLSLSSGNATTPAIFTQATLEPAGANTGGAGSTLSMAIPLDIVSGLSFLVGVPVQINCNALGDASGQLVIPANGVQIYVAEAAQ